MPSPSLVQEAKAKSTAGGSVLTPTFTNEVTAGNCLVLCTAIQNASAASVSSVSGGSVSWVRNAQIFGSGTFDFEIWHGRPAIGPISPSSIKTPGTTISNSSNGGTTAWVNPSNANADDASYATCSPTAANPVSQWLQSNQFAFSIPAGATVRGILVEVKRKVSVASGVIDESVRLWKGVLVGTDKSTGAVWDTTEGWVSFGGPTDLWGTTWTSSDINASVNFAVSFSVRHNSGTPTASVNAIRITVFYGTASDTKAITVNVSGAGGSDEIFTHISEWSNVTGVDGSGTRLSNTTTHTAGAVVPDSRPSTIVGGIAILNSTSPTGPSDASFIALTTDPAGGAQDYVQKLGYRPYSSISSYTVSWSTASATDSAGGLLALLGDPTDLGNVRSAEAFGNFAAVGRLMGTEGGVPSNESVGEFTLRYNQFMRMESVPQDFTVGVDHATLVQHLSLGDVVSAEATGPITNKTTVTLGGIPASQAVLNDDSQALRRPSTVKMNSVLSDAGTGVFRSGTVSGDIIQYWLTGASSDGGVQTDPDASLGNYRSSSEAARVGYEPLGTQDQLLPVAASRYNGRTNLANPLDLGTGSLQINNAQALRWTAPGSVVTGPGQSIATGQTLTIVDQTDPSKWVRITREDSADLVGFINFEFVEQFNNAFGQLDLVSSSAGKRYRGIMLQCPPGPRADNVRVFLPPLGSPAASTSGLGASGSGTITFAADAIKDWPWVGWAWNNTTGELVFYSSRTNSVLTVPAAGRARLGTVAAAGGAAQSLWPISGQRVAIETPNASGQIQTIANESTAPTGVSWLLPITEQSIGGISDKLGLWLERDGFAGIQAYAMFLNSLRVRFDVGSRTLVELLNGMFRVSDPALVRWEIHKAQDAEPDVLNSPPDYTTTSMPFTTPIFMTTGHDYNVAVNYRDQYNNVSQNINTQKFRYGGTGGIALKPTVPTVISWASGVGGIFRLQAIYFGLSDVSPADKWLIYIRTDGTNPDPSVDTPVIVDMVNEDGMPKLFYDTISYANGTPGKMLLRVRRSSDSVDSVSTDVYSAVASSTGPTIPSAGIFYKKIAEQHQ